MKRNLLIIVLLVVAAVVYVISLDKKTDDVSVEPGQIASLKTMSQLCTTEIYAEVPVLDTINGKVMFAIQKQRGAITFDLDQLSIDSSADTIMVNLPRETITINESTEPKSWEVIDTKAVGRLSMLRSDKFTVEEENAVKARQKKKSIRLLYQNGTVKRARADAATSLQKFLEAVYRKPVIVVYE